MPIDVLTNRYNSRRDGVSDRETELTPEKLDVNTFGKLFTRTVDGDLYAQPLIVGDLRIGGDWRSVVYLATSRNWVYAYDADDPAAHVPLWTRQLGPPVPRDAIEPGYLNFGSEIGITGTPVIDRTAGGGTIYLAAKTFRPGLDEKGFGYRLHAIDIVTGEDRVPSVLIEAHLEGRPQIRFSAKGNLNRPGLLLSDGIVYLAFGSHDDEGTYYGWILAYEAATLRQIAAYNTAPDWGEGGVWQSGTGLAGDDEGFVYAVVGNGTARARNRRERPRLIPPALIGAPEYGNALLKLKLNGAAGVLNVDKWYTTSDVLLLNDKDEDLVGGPVLFDEAVPGHSAFKYMLGGGKDGKFYLADRDEMGGWEANSTANILQAAQLCNYHIHGAPVVWTKPDGEILAFVWSEQDCIKAFSLSRRAFGPAALSTSDYRLPEDEMRMPGGILTLSWDGVDPKTAILWAVHSTRENAMNKTVAGTLRAYNALNLKKELWTSDMDASGGDRLGSLAKFSPAVVADGKVFVGTFSRELAVYGMLPNLGPDRARNEHGMFEFRGIGPDIIPWGSFAGGRYTLRLSGKGIGTNGKGAGANRSKPPAAEEGFLFANRSKNTADGAITITACLHGINAPDYPDGRAGIIVRRDVQFFGGHTQESNGYAAIIVTQDREALFVVRDQLPLKSSKGPNAVKTISRTPGLKFPTLLRLTVKGAVGKPGWLNVVAEVALTRTAPFDLVCPPGGVDVLFDAAADMDVFVGLFATAQRADKVEEHASPAFVQFSQVSV